MSKYIFPGADASTPLNWYVKECEKAGFEVKSVENIGRHYSHTLHGWCAALIGSSMASLVAERARAGGQV